MYRSHRPAPAAVLEIERHPSAVREARMFVKDRLRAAGINGDTRETAVLLTSEVVTNAFLHGRSQARVALSTTGRRLRVEVRDSNPHLPHAGEPLPDAVSGRGLAIVDTLAADWGASRTQDGKVVWFELAYPA